MSIGGSMSGDTVQLPRYLIEDSPRLAARMKAFEEAHEKAVNAAKTLGDIEDIPRLREEAAADAERQSALTRYAKEQCDQQISNAEEKAAQIVADAETEANRRELAALEMTAAAKAVKTEAESDKKGVAEGAAEVVRWREEIYAVQKALDQRSADLDSQETQLLQEKSQLETVREQIDQLLR